MQILKLTSAFKCPLDVFKKLFDSFLASTVDDLLAMSSFGLRNRICSPSLILNAVLLREMSTGLRVEGLRCKRNYDKYPICLYMVYDLYIPIARYDLYSSTKAHVQYQIQMWILPLKPTAVISTSRSQA